MILAALPVEKEMFNMFSAAQYSYIATLAYVFCSRPLEVVIDFRPEKAVVSPIIALTHI